MIRHLFQFYNYFLVVTDCGAVESLKASFILTKGYVGELFILGAYISLIIFYIKLFMIFYMILIHKWVFILSHQIIKNFFHTKTNFTYLIFLINSFKLRNFFK